LATPAGHTAGVTAAHDDWIARVTGFFDRTLHQQEPRDRRDDPSNRSGPSPLHAGPDAPFAICSPSLDVPVEDEARAYSARHLMAVTRIALGWVFLCIALGWVFPWAFLDKAFGLGFATERADAWINGGSPTFACLNFATEGKYLTFSTRQFELPPDRPATFAVDLAVKNIGGEPGDFRRGMAAFHVFDLNVSKRVFAVVGTSTRVFAMHEQLGLGGGGAGEPFYHVVESPYEDFDDDFTRLRACEITLDRSRSTAAWLVDGRPQGVRGPRHVDPRTGSHRVRDPDDAADP
jgi:Family of unknown function (DUF6081)